MYRKILYIPQPCTEKIRERERERGGGKREGEREREGERGGRERGETGGRQGETGGRQGGDRGETGGRQGGERGGEEKKTNFFFRTNEWQTSTKTPAPLIFL